MNRTFPPRAARASIPSAVCAGIVMALAGIAPVAHAGSPFSVDDFHVKQVLCDMSAIKGQLTTPESRYSGSGTCIELEAPQKIDKATNTSQFPDLNQSTEIFRANWTSQGSYSPVTKETWEKVTMPAPATDEKSPVGRPYGNYETRMICATDPWLTGIGVNCTGKTVNATGNLGDVEGMLRQLNRPVTTPSKPAQLQALVAAHDRDAKLQMRVTKLDKPNANTSAIVMAPKPTIVEPREGGTYPPQTPLRVRIVPAKNAKDTAYRIEIQVQANFDWRDVTTVATPAGVAQSPQGYRGWGGKPGVPVTAMTAIAGVYRLRARGSAPQLGQPGEWVQFKIDGQPGMQVDPMSQVKALPGKAGGAAQSAASRLGGQPSTANALGSAPAVALKNKADAASLNPQPLPPKTVPAGLIATPLDAARNKAAPVLLNPQPLPPGGLQQVPGSLQQAPSSLR